MPVNLHTSISHLSFDLSADTVQELAPVLTVLLCPSHEPVRTFEVSKGTLDELLDAIEGIARQMDDPDRIAAIRVDEDACCAELDVASRPVDPCRLH